MVDPAENAACKFKTENKVRKELVQVFFGLVLTQTAIYVAALISIWNPEWNLSRWCFREPFHPTIGPYVAACFHLLLSFALVTASWFGWQMSVKSDGFREEASVFQRSYGLSILDILLVGLYFLLVRVVEIVDVPTFPSSKAPSITQHSALPEAVIVVIVFALYFVWDLWSTHPWKWRPLQKNFPTLNHFPWPSLACSVLAIIVLATVALGGEESACLVITVDLTLICLTYLFRACKIWQKWHMAEQKPSASAPLRWAITFAVGYVILLTVAIVIR